MNIIPPTASMRTDLNEKVVAMQHAQVWRASILKVDWNLGNWCNYSCSYCPSYLHDGSRPWHGVEQAVRFIKAISLAAREQGRTVHFQWTGGEPTVHPDILRLAGAALELGNSVGLISNGSRSLSWWQEAGPIWKELTLTYHIEHVKEDRFFSVLEYLSGFAAVQVNVTAHPGAFDACDRVVDEIALRFPNVSVTLKPLLQDFGSKLMAYTSEQLERLRTKKVPPRAVESDRKTRGAMLLVKADGSSDVVAASRLVAEGKNSWFGWLCNIGIETLAIHANGVIYRANCQQGGLLGTLDSPSMQMPTSPVVCGRKTCNCLFDITTSRTAE